jgi:glycosyltransferase involved in cell wall biosynthesis
MKNVPVLTLITVSAFDVLRLERTIQSCATLNADLEHLFVIPPKDYESAKLIEAYARKVPFEVRITHDKKEGIYAAMNIGAFDAHGTYCLFLNAGDEIFSSSTINENVQTLKLNNPVWAITGVSLPWNASYFAFQDMDRDFREQKRSGYVSHQSVFVRLDVYKKINGLDVKFRIAADTKQIFELSYICRPEILKGIAIKVEEGFNVTSHNRESRIEVFRIINSTSRFKNRFIPNLNFVKRELFFILRYLLRFLRSSIS